MQDTYPPPAVSSQSPCHFVVHIGYPKTATTFLQQQVFAGNPEILNVGRPTAWYEDGRTGFRDALLCETAPDLVAMHRTLRGICQEYSEAGRKRIAVLSDEHYSTGALTSPLATLSAATIMERLSSVLPEARILIVIRHQAHILLAEYQNDLKMRRTSQSPDAWLAAQKRRADGGALRAFDFMPTIRLAHELFGASQVKVLLYEDLKFAPSRFEAGLSEALDLPCEAIRPYLDRAPENATTALEHAYLQLRRHIPPSLSHHPFINRLKPLVGLARIRQMGRRLPIGRLKSLRFSDANQAFIQERYAASNARLATMCDLPLAAYGYPYEKGDA